MNKIINEVSVYTRDGWVENWNQSLDICLFFWYFQRWLFKKRLQLENTQPLSKQDNQQNGTKFSFFKLAYTNQLSISIPQWLNQDFYWWDTQYSTRKDLSN